MENVFLDSSDAALALEGVASAFKLSSRLTAAAHFRTGQLFCSAAFAAKYAAARAPSKAVLMFLSVAGQAAQQATDDYNWASCPDVRAAAAAQLPSAAIAFAEALQSAASLPAVRYQEISGIWHVRTLPQELRTMASSIEALRQVQRASRRPCSTDWLGRALCLFGGAEVDTYGRFSKRTVQDQMEATSRAEFTGCCREVSPSNFLPIPSLSDTVRHMGMPTPTGIPLVHPSLRSSISGAATLLQMQANVCVPAEQQTLCMKSATLCGALRQSGSVAFACSGTVAGSRPAAGHTMRQQTA